MHILNCQVVVSALKMVIVQWVIFFRGVGVLRTMSPIETIQRWGHCRRVSITLEGIFYLTTNITKVSVNTCITDVSITKSGSDGKSTKIESGVVNSLRVR